MKLKRWDWDRAAFVEDEYPDTMFQPFVEWFLTTNAWHEAHELVEAKVLKLQRDLANFRAVPTTHHEDGEPTPEERKKAAQRARMAKARAAKQAKKAVTV